MLNCLKHIKYYCVKINEEKIKHLIIWSLTFWLFGVNKLHYLKEELKEEKGYTREINIRINITRVEFIEPRIN